MKKCLAIIGILTYIIFNVSFSFEKKDNAKIKVFDFYFAETKNELLTFYTMKYCDIYKVPYSFAFSICKKESGYKRWEFHENYDDKGNFLSIDRGFFQLNNRSFPELKWKDFYDPETNIKYGIEHIAYCMSHANNFQQAVYIYNGGMYNFINNKIKEITIKHAERIIKQQLHFELKI